MIGTLYERALGGERCWVRHRDGSIDPLPVAAWIGGQHAHARFDSLVVELCSGPTIDLGCGPGRFVTHLLQRGIPALGVDLSPTAIGLARRSGAPALQRDMFTQLPGTGRWHTVLLADGNVGLGGDPWRVLRRAAELLRRGGRCVTEFSRESTGVRADWVRLESRGTVGPWFRWATVGVDCAADLADDVGLALSDVHTIDGRAIAILTA